MNDLKSSTAWFHLRLCYPELTGYSFPCNEWRQKTHPLLVSSLDYSSSKFTKLNITFDTDGTKTCDGANGTKVNCKFRGIGINTHKYNKQTILDAAPADSQSWYSIGALKPSGNDEKQIFGPYPGFTKAHISLVELYMKKAPPPPLSSRRKRQDDDQFLTYGDHISISSVSKREAAESELEVSMRSYGSRLRYECGPARKFLDDFTQVHYEDRWMTCNWNKTWTRSDTLDRCDWVQCLHPPQVSWNLYFLIIIVCPPLLINVILLPLLFSLFISFLSLLMMLILSLLMLLL